MIQIIPKAERRIFTLEKIFLTISIFFLIFSLSAFFYLMAHEKKANKEIKALEEKISSSKTPEEISLENEVLKYQQKISDFSKIIKEHFFPSQFFSLLEKNTHPKIFFSQIELDLINSKCILSGQAQDFYTLGQQYEIFKNNPAFKTELSNLSLGKEGKVEFKFQINFDKSILKK